MYAMQSVCVEWCCLTVWSWAAGEVAAAAPDLCKPATSTAEAMSLKWFSAA